MNIKHIGVCGAGIMGSGIAQVCAEAAYSVTIYDISEEMLAKGFGGIQKNLKRAAEKGKLAAAEAEAIIGRITTSADISVLAKCDAVIEAVSERMEIKKVLFAQLDGVCAPEAILVTNTSGLSITEIASVTKRPEKVVGMHFFNPVPVMKLVEVIRGWCTDDSTFDTAMKLTVSIAKEPIAVQEAPLFAVNRILVPMLNEAFIVLQEGVASAEDIDKGMKLGANHPIGPLALADMVGLDTLYQVMETLYTETGDSKYRPATLMKKLVRAGKFGRKTGEGVYKY
jgi:3-hydroxybutyryl-CoA dehydrogenase